jgi:hypothetical protein
MLVNNGYTGFGGVPAGRQSMGFGSTLRKGFGSFGNLTAQPKSGDPYTAAKNNQYNALTNAGITYNNQQAFDNQNADAWRAKAQQDPTLLNTLATGVNATANGSMLNSNPYLNTAMENANRSTINQFNSSVLPQTLMGNIGSGNYNSSLGRQQVDRANQQLGDTISRNNNQVAYQNYGDERSRQMQALGMADGAYNAQFSPFEQQNKAIDAAYRNDQAIMGLNPLQAQQAQQKKKSKGAGILGTAITAGATAFGGPAGGAIGSAIGGQIANG